MRAPAPQPDNSRARGRATNQPSRPPAASMPGSAPIAGFPREIWTRPVSAAVIPMPPATWWGSADRPDRAETSSTARAIRTRGRTTEKMPNRPAEAWWIASPASPEIWNHSRSAITMAAATATKAAASRLTCESVAFHARTAPTPARPSAEKKRARKPGCVASGWGALADLFEPPLARGRAGALPDDERGDDCAMILPPYRPPRPHSARRAARDQRRMFVTTPVSSTFSTCSRVGMGRADSWEMASAAPAFAMRHAVSRS